MENSSARIKETGRRVIQIEIEAITGLLSKIDENFAQAIELILQIRGRVIVTGMGKSGAIGKKIASTLASTGTTSYFLHPAEGIHGDLGMVHKDDIVIAISKSGETAELNEILPALHRLGVPIIALTGSAQSTLGRYAQVILDISVPEEACPHNLAPTSSSTATLVMGDALAIALLEMRGFSAQDFALLHPGGSLGRRLLMRVSDIMESGDKIAVCRPGDTMHKAVLEMAHKRGICSVTEEDNRLSGVITTGDLNRLLEKAVQFRDIPVEEVMNRNPKIIQDSELAVIAFQEMQQHRIVAMPVIDPDNKLVGVIHLHDLMQKGISG